MTLHPNVKAWVDARNAQYRYMKRVKRALKQHGHDARLAEDLYTLGVLPACFPMPAIIYDVAYQLDDGDYWCGIYDRHKEQHCGDDCFTMLWNISNHRGHVVWWPTLL